MLDSWFQEMPSRTGECRWFELGRAIADGHVESATIDLPGQVPVGPKEQRRDLREAHDDAERNRYAALTRHPISEHFQDRYAPDRIWVVEAPESIAQMLGKTTGQLQDVCPSVTYDEPHFEMLPYNAQAFWAWFRLEAGLQKLGQGSLAGTSGGNRQSATALGLSTDDALSIAKRDGQASKRLTPQELKVLKELIRNWPTQIASDALRRKFEIASLNALYGTNTSLNKKLLPLRIKSTSFEDGYLLCELERVD